MIKSTPGLHFKEVDVEQRLRSLCGRQDCCVESIQVGQTQCSHPDSATTQCDADFTLRRIHLLLVATTLKVDVWPFESRRVWVRLSAPPFTECGICRKEKNLWHSDRQMTQSSNICGGAHLPGGPFFFSLCVIVCSGSAACEVRKAI